jgi:hypothetical protein
MIHGARSAHPRRERGSVEKANAQERDIIHIFTKLSLQKFLEDYVRAFQQSFCPSSIPALR